jgi:hypothetical protein
VSRLHQKSRGHTHPIVTFREKAKEILASDQGAEIDEGMVAHIFKLSIMLIEFTPVAEKEYLLEYYSLVREGKTNYVSNAPMLLYFGHRGQEPADFFKTYSVRALYTDCDCADAELRP